MAKAPPTQTCDHCGKEFQRYLPKARKKKYCTHDCYANYLREAKDKKSHGQDNDL